MIFEPYEPYKRAYCSHKPPICSNNVRKHAYIIVACLAVSAPCSVCQELPMKCSSILLYFNNNSTVRFFRKNARAKIFTRRLRTVQCGQLFVFPHHFFGNTLFEPKNELSNSPYKSSTCPPSLKNSPVQYKNIHFYTLHNTPNHHLQTLDIV